MNNEYRKFELEMIDRKMDQNLDTRHAYLSFAFTASITILAAVFVLSLQGSAAWLVLFPFCVIIPFQARISYARLSFAKYEAYIKVFYTEEVHFYHYPVYDLFGFMGKVIAIISNYELTLLSLVICACYFFITKPVPVLSPETIIPLALTTIVGSIATYSFPYGKFMRIYEKKFLKEKEINSKKE